MLRSAPGSTTTETVESVGESSIMVPHSDAGGGGAFLSPDSGMVAGGVIGLRVFTLAAAGVGGDAEVGGATDAEVEGVTECDLRRPVALSTRLAN